MANKIERWFSKKKNRKAFMYILGAVCLFFYIRARFKANEGDFSQLRTGGGFQTGNGGTLPVSGGTSPGTVEPYVPGNGNYSPKLAGFGWPGHINMEKLGSPGNWVFNDTVEIPVPNGYSIRYYVNSGETIIQKTPLRGYVWNSNFPITFTKCLVKDGVPDLYFWGDGSQPNDGIEMSRHTSMTFQTFYFTKA